MKTSKENYEELYMLMKFTASTIRLIITTDLTIFKAIRDPH